MNDIDRIRPADVESLLAASAHFVKADGGEGTDERKSRSQRKDDRQHVEPESHARKHETHNGVHRAEEHDVAPIGAEIVEALRDHLPDIGHRDLADGGSGGVNRLLDVLQRVICRCNPVRRSHDLCACVLDGVLDGVHDRSSRTKQRSRAAIGRWRAAIPCRRFTSNPQP